MTRIYVQAAILALCLAAVLVAKTYVNRFLASAPPGGEDREPLPVVVEMEAPAATVDAAPEPAQGPVATRGEGD